MHDEIFVQDVEYDKCATKQLLESLDRGSIVDRARSLAALARRTAQDENLVEVVVTAISTPHNMEAKLMGITSVSHVGFACLWCFGPAQAQTKLQVLMQAWPEPDRSDLLWFLKTQGIMDWEK